MKLELKYALLCGVGLSSWVLVEFMLGFHTTSLEIGQYSGFFSVLIPIILISSALRELQEKNDGLLPWKNGIEIGFRIAFFSSVIFTLFMILYHNVINPDWIDATVEWQRKKLILGGASDDEIGRFMNMHRRTNSLAMQIVTGFIGSITIGVIITLIEIPLIRKFSTPKT